ncbi:hypothetical protein [Polaribacter sp. L3A8]|uniref:hypothetical protein n=1 Tax=Polaribacter sp. L3A8 TaxID=2686361 RepID=UPI00131B68AF|nr:hypothetical protein [Polaribacter sp. L3A8]
MELNKEQIQRIEHYLNLKNITYIDVRFEILDHIVSDIESKMTNENFDFETVFYNVTGKWDAHLKETSSWYFGVGFSAPKIILEKAKKSFKKWFFLMPVPYLLSYFLINKMDFIYSENIENGLNLVFQIVTILTVVLFLFLMISKNKKRTTYSFILKTQSLNLLLGAILLIDFDFFNREGYLNPFQVGLLFSFVFGTFIYYRFYKKHQEAIKKYKIS